MKNIEKVTVKCTIMNWIWVSSSQFVVTNVGKGLHGISERSIKSTCEVNTQSSDQKFDFLELLL